MEDLKNVVQKKDKSKVKRFDTSVFDGEYITGDVSDHYLEQLELLRSDGAKQEKEASEIAIIGLHNSA